MGHLDSGRLMGKLFYGNHLTNRNLFKDVVVLFRI